jgi:hypothetical protein
LKKLKVIEENKNNDCIIEIVEIEGEVELSREGEYLVITTQRKLI